MTGTRTPRQICVLVCGGRDCSAADAWNWLERNAKDAIAERLRETSFEIATVIHGNACGADQGGAEWGRSEHARVVAYTANWKRDGKAAGPIRNRRMLTEGKPDVVIALPGRRGTANMVGIAEAAGVPVIRAMLESRP